MFVSLRNGGDHVRVFQRHDDSLLRNSDRVGGRPVRCYLLSHARHQKILAQVSRAHACIRSIQLGRNKMMLMGDESDTRAGGTCFCTCHRHALLIRGLQPTALLFVFSAGRQLTDIFMQIQARPHYLQPLFIKTRQFQTRTAFLWIDVFLCRASALKRAMRYTNNNACEINTKNWSVLQIFLPVPLLVLRLPLPVQCSIQWPGARHLVAFYTGKPLVKVLSKFTVTGSFICYGDVPINELNNEIRYIKRASLDSSYTNMKNQVLPSESKRQLCLRVSLILAYLIIFMISKT
jgi:hypothetical protein